MTHLNSPATTGHEPPSGGLPEPGQPEVNRTDGQTVQPDIPAEPLRVRLGRRLRAAREEKRLDIESCGHSLHLPVRVLRKLEEGDYSGIDSCVYLRNYLTSYGTCVGLPEQDVREAVEQLAPADKQPGLVSTGGVSHSHYLLQRYTTAATYAVLTAVIVVPLVWLGLKGGLDRELARMQPLDSAPVTQQQRTADAGTGSNGSSLAARHPQASPSRSKEQPLMASMAPFSALDSVDDLPDPVTPPAVSVAGTHTLELALSQPSWVEITTADGDRLEYSLLPAGTHKTFHSSQPLQISIGNTSGATVRLDGKPVDLDDYRHANVAHFDIAMHGGKASVQSR